MQVHREVGSTARDEPNELTKDNVDQVLNEIRGYLFADGGDIDVVNVEDGKVYVRCALTDVRHVPRCAQYALRCG